MDDLRRGPASRVPAAAAAGLTVAAGLGVRAGAAALGVRAGAVGEVAKYAGDALYTVLVYALVVLVAPAVRPARAALWAAAVSWAVELFQATGLPEAWGRHSGLVQLVLGSTFDPPDLAWYPVGALGAALVHRALRAQRATAPGGSG
ncbi:DUF2809 domain-containing protein [Kitasatospora sp. NPDC001539]|uniref:DUF2809 domain-containing protein n=1 Tax=Kitasatospora sp. NPDC001539 TaxID=3154384 RepID=UPI003321BCE5